VNQDHLKKSQPDHPHPQRVRTRPGADVRSR
jgi:hypothetical protein